jgi:hypothetical protein
MLQLYKRVSGKSGGAHLKGMTALCYDTDLSDAECRNGWCNTVCDRRYSPQPPQAEALMQIATPYGRRSREHPVKVSRVPIIGKNISGFLNGIGHQPPSFGDHTS